MTHSFMCQIFAFSQRYSKHCDVVSEVTNLATIHVCIWYQVCHEVMLVGNLLLRITVHNMHKTNAAYSSSDSIVAVPVGFPTKSLTAL